MQRNRKKWEPCETRFSEKLKQIRKRHIGYTQELVSRYSGIARCKLSQWERGAQIPNFKNMEKLARYYLDLQIIAMNEYYELLQLHRDEVCRKHCANYQQFKQN